MGNRKIGVRQGFAMIAVMAVGSPVAWACATAYDDIITAVDWSDVVTGVVAIAALVAAVLVVERGARMLLVMIEGRRIAAQDAEDAYWEANDRAAEEMRGPCPGCGRYLETPCPCGW